MIRTLALPILLLSVLTGGLTACSESSRPAFPPGPALQEPIGFEFAVYYPEPPREEPRAVLDDLLASEFGSISRVDEVREKEIAGRRVVSARWVTDARESYAAPDLALLRDFGYGLDAAQSEALQKTDNVLILRFGHGKEHVWTGMRDALRLTSALARRTGGLPWDEDTREMFTPDAWDERRIEAWTGTDSPPDLRQHFTVHVYRKDNGFQRAVSLGMGKFGLPDLVVEDVSGSAYRNMVGVINLLAQVLAEGAEIGSDGAIDVNLHAIRNDAMREDQLGTLAAKATGKARLRLVQGVPEKGDADNRLAEIEFDGYPGPDPQARQKAMLVELFGSEEDATVNVKHDEVILEASRRAREKLLALQPAFQAGLPPGDVLLVKAPFKTVDGGNEWMWVEVITWKGGTITGTLQNEPALVKGLKPGQRVEVNAADVFDYLHRHTDGSSEGNETAKYLQGEE